jgi:hypothetical protein
MAPEMDVLPECQKGFTDIRLAVGLMERDILTHGKVLDKLTEAVEKIQEMNASLVRMIDLQELKHDGHVKFEDTTTEELKEISTRIDVVHKAVFEVASGVPTQPNEDVNATLKELNKWRWILVGMVFILGWLIAHIKWSVLAQLFGG